MKNLNNKDIKVENNEVNLYDELNDEHNEDGVYDINIENEDNKSKNFELLKQNNDTTNNKETKFILNKKNTIIITSMISIIVLFGIYIGKTVPKYNNKIFPGTSIYNIDVSNLSKSEFLNKVTGIEDAIQNNKMIISINNKKYSISYENLISKYNNEKLYDDIMNSQNKKNIFSKFMAIILKEKKITQEERQIAYDNYETTDDHGMQIFGVAKDKEGNKFYMVKNSWGETGPYDGFWYASEAFVQYKTINVAVNKAALPKAVANKLNVK